MAIQVLLDDLARAGVALSVDGDRLRFRAPRGALTPDLRARSTAAREAILARLLDDGGLPARLAEWPEDWRHAFDERAAIIEFEGNRPRDVAEEEAEVCVRAEHARASSAAREGR